MSLSKSREEQAFAKNLGGWIRELRSQLGLSLEAFGAELGVTRNTIWHWETGATMPNLYQYSLIKRAKKRAEAAQ